MRTQFDKGSVTLETSIVLPIFIIMFMFIFGIFRIVSAQNQVTHTLIQASKSLSMDSYLLENVESAYEAKTNFWGGLSDMILDLVRLDTDEYFSTTQDWYNSETGNPNVAKKRFVAYLAGGDENLADEKLRDMGIVNGLDGISFEMNVEDEKVVITIKYEIQYWFDFWNMGTVPMEQSITTRLWK